MQNDSDLFSCLLDFSKAFDLVNFEKLFRRLIDRKFPFIYLRLLLFIYRNQKCYIRWNSQKSELFTVQNGVRQGAMLSPNLFCVYLDPLLEKLRHSGLGCHIGGKHFGSFGYADDIILLTTSRESLQLMLNICEQYSEEYSMKFSTDPHPKKTKSRSSGKLSICEYQHKTSQYGYI